MIVILSCIRWNLCVASIFISLVAKDIFSCIYQPLVLLICEMLIHFSCPLFLIQSFWGCLIIYIYIYKSRDRQRDQSSVLCVAVKIFSDSVGCAFTLSVSDPIWWFFMSFPVQQDFCSENTYDFKSLIHFIFLYFRCLIFMFESFDFSLVHTIRHRSSFGLLHVCFPSTMYYRGYISSSM